MEKRILFDTSVYGEFVYDREFFSILKQKKEKIECIFYGNNIIRNELRATPKKSIIFDKSLRTYLLYFYDQLITKENHILKINFLVENLAQRYYDEYKKRGGSVGEENIKNDLFIVASATFYQMAILVSSDKRTLLSDAAIKAYKHVNEKNGLQNPEFLHYNSFRNKILKRCDISWTLSKL